MPESIGELRRSVTRFAESAGVPDPPLADMRLAVSEALSNAVMHGYRDQPTTGEVEVEVEVEADMRASELRIVVRDTGLGLTPRFDSPGLGLGLPIISTVADSVEFRSLHPGTELHMRFDIAL